jgi:TetR/AcrR family transcriptional regulator
MPRQKKPQRQPDPRRAQTREALIRAAEAALQDLPLEEITVQEIARRAGVAVTSIYNHFGSKAALQAAIAERALQVDREYMDRAYVQRRTPVEQLKSAAAEYLQFYLDHPDYFRLIAFPPEASHPAARELNERIVHRVTEQNARMVRALRDGIDRGQIRAVDPEEVATLLWSAWNGMISLGWRTDALRRNRTQLKRMLELATDIVAAGLTIAPPARR